MAQASTNASAGEQQKAGQAKGGKSIHDTPAMKQYHRFKHQHPGCVLLFRMGDFYELFYDDAELAHKILGVTLTQRTEGIPMAGVPYHAIESYLRRLLQAGYRVAVCDQVEDPSQAKGVVDRDVTRVVTPGTLTDDTLLEEGQENLLAAIVFHGPGKKTNSANRQSATPPNEDDLVSIAWAELSTGSFQFTTLRADTLADELARIAPRELLFCETATGETPPRVETLATRLGCPVTDRPAWQFRQDEGHDILKRQYRVAQLAGFGIDEQEPALAACGAIVHYLLETQRTGEAGHLPHLRPPRAFDRSDHLVIDQTSLRSLEVERTLRSESAEGALLGTLQHCVTAMGKRQLRQWLRYPLRDRETIEARQRLVQALVDDSWFLETLRETLDSVQDVPRIAARLGIGRASPRDLLALGQSAGQARQLAELLADRPAAAEHHRRASELVQNLNDLGQELLNACVDQPPAHLREGGLIRDGYDPELDECRTLQRDSHQWLAEYQQRLIEETGITHLKVGYNKVFGYYIELTAANRDKAPTEWSRKQTLKNAERFITQELKDFESKVLSAETRGIAREQTLFGQLCDRARQQLEALHQFGQLAAELDVLACFARHAIKHRYVRPQIADEPVLDIQAGRHPVLDQTLGDRFVPNDVALGSPAQGAQAEGPGAEPQPPDTDEGSGQGQNEGHTPGDPPADSTTRPPDHSASEPLGHSPAPASLALITGPNMAGKSTYIRQTALITLLAQTGSFVPAEHATVGLCDRIFTRVGASDELHTGQSTFMVEMTETANICHHATERSLVILDEIGRGTSTLDGLALAWAVAEHLASRAPRCLFATHYHELTELADRHQNIANLNVTVREWQDQVVFLHRIVPGAADRSYGIHVARIAGLPENVVDRARDLLSNLAVHSVDHAGAAAAAAGSSQPPEDNPQMGLFTEYVPHPVVQELAELDLHALTPLQAFDALRRLKEHAQGNNP
jgi:DNA mismatch repair protein MutS